MKSVEWTGPAKRDLTAIDAYWWSVDQEQAERMLTAIERSAEFLSGMPRAGPQFEEGKPRKWTVRSTPYLLIYRFAADRIEILRVFNGKQDWMAEV